MPVRVPRVSDYGPYRNSEGIPYSLIEEWEADGRLAAECHREDYALCDRPETERAEVWFCPRCGSCEVWRHALQILVSDCKHCGATFECWRNDLEDQERWLKKNGLWIRWCFYYGLGPEDELLPEVKQKYDNGSHDWSRSVFHMGLEGRFRPTWPTQPEPKPRTWSEWFVSKPKKYVPPTEAELERGRAEFDQYKREVESLAAAVKEYARKLGHSLE